jgi:acyl-CoA synthetase (NDP forming)
VPEHPLEATFHPRSVALVGMPRDLDGRGSGFFHSLLDQGFPDAHPLYLVNPNATVIAERPCYATLLDCPGPVDHVISLVPARAAAGLVEQCVAKGVRTLHLYTAGFAESGDAELAALERALVARARAGGVRVIGPNCMGLYVPAAQLAFYEELPTEAGDVFGISQSGGNAGDIIRGLAARGLRFSKLVSFGNGRDVAAAELFEYAAQDAETRLVVAYLEGVPDGPALLRALRACAREKPTIVLKGGVSRAGARAVSSHTASLAGATEVFDALCRQAGAIRVETMDELQDLAVLVSTRGRRIAGPRGLLVGRGGGFSVLSTDEVARHGIDLPELAPEAQRGLREHIPIAGNSIRNPLDVSSLSGAGGPAMQAVLRIAATAPGFDFMFATPESAPARRDDGRRTPFGTPPEDDAAGREQVRRAFAELAELQAEHGRPVVVVSRARGDELPPDAETLRTALDAGLAVFPGVPRAARAVGQLLRWRRSREGLPPIL